MRMQRSLSLASTILAMAVVVLGVAAVNAAVRQQSTVDSPPAVFRADAAVQDHSAHFLKCAKVCADCAVVCDDCYHHCADIVSTGPKKEHSKSMKLCTDCAETCHLAATLAGRHSQFAVGACDFCARCCDECASACEA